MSKKHYIITSITLGAIAAVSAGIIGLTNLITRGPIAKNEQKRIKKGIAEIFGENAEIVNEFEINDKDYKYLVYGYEIKNDESEANKYAIRTLGSNTYGKVSLLIGVSSDSSEADFVFNRLTVIVDEQTYASTLEDEYIDVINAKPTQENIDDVSCGATYGATLVRDMINVTIDYANNVLRNG